MAEQGHQVPLLARGVRSFDRAVRLAPGRWSFDWHFATNDRVFVGHFPHHPVLAGAFLLEMAQRSAEWALYQSLQRVFRVVRVERMRFISPVQPGDDCTLHLHWPVEPQPVSLEVLQVDLQFAKGDERVAQGAMRAAVRHVAVPEVCTP